MIVLTGTTGNDSIVGGDRPELIFAFSGDDTVRGHGGNDTVYGNDNLDLLYGGAGNDYLTGGKGADTLYGNVGNDILHGKAGNDILFGASGNDLLEGGTESDELHGGSGDDILVGEEGNDSVSGGAGDDLLSGSEGSDTLVGGPGKDTLFGGGTESDHFVFLAHDGRRDTVVDFRHSDGDIIDLSGAYSGTLEFIGTERFDGAGQVRYVAEGSDLIVKVNLDDDLKAELAFKLLFNKSLVEADFVL